MMQSTPSSGYWRAEPGSKLAALRIEGHLLLEYYVKQRGRNAAYKWLAKELGMSLADCHFGHMDEAQCEAAIRVLKRK